MISEKLVNPVSNIFLKVWGANLKRRLKSDISLSKSMSPTQRSITPNPLRDRGNWLNTQPGVKPARGCNPEPMNRTEEPGNPRTSVRGGGQRCGTELVFHGRLGICPRCGFMADRDKNASLNIYTRMWGSLGSLLNAPAVKDEARRSGGRKMRG